VQSQERIEWPRKLVVAKAYIDQLERSKSLPAGQIASLRQAIQKTERSRMNPKEIEKLKALSPSLEKTASETTSEVDSARMRELAQILSQPER
jgi:hypothetical protein